MKNIKLSDNFRLREFTYSKVANHNVSIKESSHEYWLLAKLVINIQNLRDHFHAPIRITSGIRNKFVWNKLKDKGYNPSVRTDHSFGLPGVNQWGIGACDFFIVMRKKSLFVHRMWKMYFHIIRFMNFGQVIIYLTRYYTPIFIHLSNPYDVVYSKSFTHIRRPKYPILFKLSNKKSFSSLGELPTKISRRYSR